MKTAPDPMTVATSRGLVRGTAEGGTVRFAGIPFAEVPVGALRFRAPEPAGGLRVDALRGRFAPLGLPIDGDFTFYLAGGDGIETFGVGTVREALDELHARTFDCVVMDLTLADGSGFDLLERMADDDAFSFPPVVIYTGTDLSQEDEQRLRRYSSSIIVKGARSPERLLDEVTLFLHQVESQLTVERQRMLQKVRDRESIFEGRVILIVEDDVRNVFALSSVLEPKGAQVVIARNGREALEALARRPDVALVLMDLMMPEMDGLTAIREIRKEACWAKLPIIAADGRDAARPPLRRHRPHRRRGPPCTSPHC